MAVTTMTSSEDELAAVFGPGSHGTTPEERARTSNRIFIRSQHQLTFYDEGATGRQLTALEALRDFGWDNLRQLGERQAVPLVFQKDEPYLTLLLRARDLRLNFQKAAKQASWSEKLLEAFRARQQIPFRKLERLAQGLALDARLLGITRGAGGDKDLGVRLRELRGGDAARFSDSVVLGLAEAAWVIRQQHDLARMLDGDQANSLVSKGFAPESDFGTHNRPAWSIGYNLAARARALLHLPQSEPIEQLKELIEDRLRIPVVQLELPDAFAGATVANGNVRGIVVNLRGLNQNVWVRRMTLAHELGHLLWDPDDRLHKLVVDGYSDVEERSQPVTDFAEMRANGFAIQFLAPQSAVKADYEAVRGNAEGLERVMTKYGISKTSATYHLQNAYRPNDVDLSRLRVHVEPSADWMGREELAVSFFRPESVPVSRRGRFAAYVARAVDAKLISRDTAAALLGCGLAEVDTALNSIRQIVF